MGSEFTRVEEAQGKLGMSRGKIFTAVEIAIKNAVEVGSERQHEFMSESLEDDMTRAGLDHRGLTGPALGHTLSEAVEHRNTLLETAWSIICNAGSGNWELESADWRKAAVKFRAEYFIMLSSRIPTWQPELGDTSDHAQEQ